MAEDEIHKGDVGTVFEVTLKDGASIVDVSGASTKQIIFKKPNGGTVEKDADFVTDGQDGKLKYTTLADDLDVIGVWKLQAYVVISGSGDWKSDVGEFTVYDNL